MFLFNQIANGAKKALKWIIAICKKIVQWVKEKILWVKNKFSDE